MSKQYLYNDCDECPYCYKDFYKDGTLKIVACCFDDVDFVNHPEPICEEVDKFYYN